ncbi:unnamed protein product [Durusdinium trenchii]|uniref:Uncharacterized protein n=1 Tax=Durusdinium trenchii TaxID=1381693 RepID=A0ABP0JAF0_9DINO
MSGCAAIFVQAWAMQRVHASVILACFAGECASAAFDAAVLMQLEAAVFEAAICLRSYVSCSRALCSHACSSLGAALLPLMVPADEGVFAAFEGLREEWYNHRRLRERVRSLGRLVVDKPKEGEAEEAGQVVAKTVENMKYNAPALKPMMEKMRGQFHVVPQIESLQAELQALYISAGLNPSGKVISDQAWSLRYLYSLLKKYLYNKTPPRDACTGELLRAWGLDMEHWTKGFDNHFCSLIASIFRCPSAEASQPSPPASEDGPNELSMVRLALRRQHLQEMLALKRKEQEEEKLKQVEMEVPQLFALTDVADTWPEAGAAQVVDGVALPSADVEALKLGLRTETAGLDTQQLEGMLEETDKMISEHQMRGEVDSIAPPSVFAESVQSLGATRAPAVQVAEHAQAILDDDAANGFARKDRTLQRLARAGAAHSARDVFAALKDAALKVSMKISYVSLGQAREHPMIPPSDFVLALTQRNRLALLLPDTTLDSSACVLEEYWRRFKLQFGADHDVFSHVPPEHLSSCVPIKIHGDEGRSLLEFLESALMQPDRAELVLLDRRLALILLVAKSINSCMRKLYGAGAWLRDDEAAGIAADGLCACRGYRALATESLERGEPRFPLHSKFHMLVHTFRNMELDARKLTWQESPMCDNCQMDEGFVGQLARYSRRVSPKSTIHRMLDVYLTSLWRLWRT